MNKKHCKLSRYKLAIVGYVGSTVSVYISIRFPHSINESTNCRTYQALLATIRFHAFRKIVFEPFISRTCVLNMNDGQLSNNLMRKIKKKSVCVGYSVSQHRWRGLDRPRHLSI